MKKNPQKQKPKQTKKNKPPKKPTKKVHHSFISFYFHLRSLECFQNKVPYSVNLFSLQSFNYLLLESGNMPAMLENYIASLKADLLINVLQIKAFTSTWETYSTA